MPVNHEAGRGDACIVLSYEGCQKLIHKKECTGIYARADENSWFDSVTHATLLSRLGRGKLIMFGPRPPVV